VNNTDMQQKHAVSSRSCILFTRLKVFALVHSHSNVFCSVHTQTWPSSSDTRPLQRSRATRGQVHCCATRCQCKIHCAHAAKLCNTRPSCATRSGCEFHCAHAAKLCYTLPMQNSLCTRGGQAVQVLHHAAKQCNTRPSCATRWLCTAT
jgi:hypothetical protein